MKLFNRKQEKRDMTQNEPQVYSAALPFTQLFQQNSAQALSAVFRATEIISDSIAMLPIKVKINNGKHKDEMENHPLYIAFDNNLISKFTLMKLLITDVILKGNGFAYIMRAEDGTVIGIRYCEPGSVTVNYNSVKQTLSYKISNVAGKIEPINMIHLVKNTRDGVNGISVLNYAKRSINLANSTETAAESYFSNGCQPSGVLTVQGQLSSKQREDIRNSWNQIQGGTGGGLAVLQGNMTYQATSKSSSDSQMLETRQYNVQDIARFFGISPILLGDLSHSSFSTLEAVQNSFLLHTLQPYINMVEHEFNRKLLKPSERENLEINLDETYLMKTDKTATATYYSTLIDKGILCINEARNELGYSEIEGGDKHVIPFTDINQNTINSKSDNNEDI